MSLAATAQTNIWYWQNGTATKVEAVDSITFTEPRAVTPETPTHEYVDLGLKVKWATCNVGAEKPEEYGDYFAWGETAAKSDYSWATYKFTTDDGGTFTKYTGSDKTLLDAADDAATANWGNDWRTPRKEQWDELMAHTNREWTTMNGVEGWLFTSRRNGKRLFLPAAGYRWDGELNNAGSYGCYWSSSLYTSDPSYAWSFAFNAGNTGMSCDGRYDGQSVRAVREN